MASKDYKAFIVEGEAREPLIIDNISKVFFAHSNFKIITLPAGENIYMLWKRLKEDDFDTDIIEVLRESSSDISEQLNGLARNDFSEVYLFFDYDVHQVNLGKNDECNVVEQMLISFNNETENGKLYISYPMVEALRDFIPGKCGSKDNCFVTLDKIGDYKNTSSIQAYNPHFKSYDIDVWKGLIDVFVMRVSCLYGQSGTLEYENYTKMVSPLEIYAIEEKQVNDKGVFVLSAFPEFLIDYFGVRLWKTCVKHPNNQMGKLLCDT